MFYEDNFERYIRDELEESIADEDDKAYALFDFAEKMKDVIDTVTDKINNSLNDNLNKSICTSNIEYKIVYK